MSRRSGLWDRVKRIISIGDAVSIGVFVGIGVRIGQQRGHDWLVCLGLGVVTGIRLLAIRYAINHSEDKQDRKFGALRQWDDARAVTFRKAEWMCSENEPQMNRMDAEKTKSGETLWGMCRCGSKRVGFFLEFTWIQLMCRCPGGIAGLRAAPLLSLGKAVRQ